MPVGRVGGTLHLAVNGIGLLAKGAFTWNLGRPKRTGVVGWGGSHGYSEAPQIPYVEGKITLDGALGVDELINIKDATATLSLPNGRTVVLNNAYYAGDGTGDTGEGEFDARFEGETAEEF